MKIKTKFMIKNLTFTLHFILFIISLYISTIWINFYYLSPRNVDFFYYFDYVNYYIGVDTEFKNGHGPFYFFLIYRSLKNNFEIINNSNIEFILSYSIQNLNLFLYIFGLLGIYKLFKLYEFKTTNTLLALTAFNFFPQSIYLRAVMKPEILGFCLFPWILYFVKLFRIEQNIKYLYLAIPFLSLIATSKPSITGMIFGYLFISKFNLIRKIQIKKLFSLSLVLVIFLFASYYESYSITTNQFYERKYDANYDNVAPTNIIFKLNLKKVYNSPFFDYEYQLGKYSTHANSVINIVILDTFGDYFNQLFDFNSNFFDQNRKDLFSTAGEFLISENRVIKYSGPYGLLLETNLDLVRKGVSSTISILFYLILFYLFYKDKKNRNIYILPFFGIIILYINSLGIPSKNFNPYLGDTFKTFYYSFFISITFIFVFLKFFSKIIYVKLLFLFIWVATMFFIAGHPKQNDQNFSEYLIQSNEYSFFCEVNNILFFENEFIKSIHKTGNANNKLSNCENINKLKKNSIGKNITNQYLESCVVDNKLTEAASTSKSCINSNINYFILNGDNRNNSQTPYTSIVTFFLAMLFVFFHYQIVNLSKSKLIRNLNK